MDKRRPDTQPQEKTVLVKNTLQTLLKLCQLLMERVVDYITNNTVRPNIILE